MGLILGLVVSLPVLIGQQCMGPLPQEEVIPLADVQELPRVRLATNMGDIVLELFPQQAPLAVGNFLRYVGDGFYDGCVFHQAVADRSISGGVYNADLSAKTSGLRDPIANESNNGLANIRGRVAVLEPSGTGTGTSGFLIHLADDASKDFNLNTQQRGMTVFGRVIEGMAVAEAIGQVTTTIGQSADGKTLSGLPAETVSIISATVDAGESSDENVQPVADAGPDRKVVAGLTAKMRGFNYDSNGDTLQFSWSQTAGTPVTLSDASIEHPTFTVPDGTTPLSFSVTVTDGRGGVSADSVTLTPVAQPRVRLNTTKGDIVLDLLAADAPVTVANFLQYVDDEFYDGTIFHRVVNTPTPFVVQGGGFLPDLSAQSGLRDPIVNEFNAAHSNLRGTLSMAKVGGNPDSATSQFFINLADNSGNLDSQNGGFAVFASVAEGMDVVDQIAAEAVSTQQDSEGHSFENVPVEPIIVNSATIEGT